MNGGPDETVHVISLGKFENNKKYKEQLLQEIIAAICAMLNSNGGKVVLHIETDGNDVPVEGSPFSKMSLVIRILEQSLISIIGSHQTISKMNFAEDKESIVVLIKKANSLITNYNLYLPSQTQVILVSPLEPLETVKNDIINRRVVLEPVQLGSHCQIFLKDNKCSSQENKTVAFKNVKAGQSKRTTLADRMTGKGNKFSCYVSAFANYRGGHIYYGIRDDGLVEGELIPNENDKNDIIKKVEKTINKMIWPEHIGQPKRGEHWEIFFEPVVDENANHIPSTFVIVIYIAPCVGGVFTEEPECYEMVEGKVEKMSFANWKKRVLQRDGVDIPAAVQRIEWSSSATERRCTEADEVLMTAINNGKWNFFSKTAKVFGDYPEVEVKLVVLSKRVIASYRKGCLSTARVWLVEYHKLLSKAKDLLIFEAIYLYLKAALERVQRRFQAARQILDDALLKVEHLPPGLVTAAILSFAAIMDQNSGNKNVPSPVEFSRKVLAHLKHAPRSQVQVDMEQKAYIILATFHLGCNMSGIVIEKGANESKLETAKSSVMALNKLVCDGYALNRYREVQFNLVQSKLYYRYSQVSPEGGKVFLEEAFQFSKKAEYLARAFNFDEMLTWANASAALCTEGLMHASLMKMASVREKGMGK
jgi:hypothetical protein